MSNVRWGRIDEKLSSELAYLGVFQEQVEESKIVTIMLAQFVAHSVGGQGVSRETLQAVESEIAATIQLTGRADVAVTVSDAVAKAGIAEPAIEIGPLIESFGDRIERIIWGEVGSRARSYADAAYGTHENSVKARENDNGAVGVRRITEGDDRVCAGCEAESSDEYVPVDEIADIGTQECAGNDRCWYQFQYAGVGPLSAEL